MTRSENERLLDIISEYLCFTPCAISKEDIDALTADGSLTRNEAYQTLLTAHCGHGYGCHCYIYSNLFHIHLSVVKRGYSSI